jgi:3-oxoacyl-[acyl-carrier-protein] synthase III
MISSRILGVGTYVPPQVLTNNDLSKIMDTSDEWIQQRTGIKQRHWVNQDEPTGTSDLALIAAERAIENSKIKKEDLDMIILGTLSPDHEFPGTACFLQAKLGVPGIPAIDIRQQCTSFIYGLSIADQFIKTGFKKNILVVGTEVHSKGLDKSTRGREVSVLFGDGAGAMVVAPAEKDNPSKILSTHLYADGTYAKELWLPNGGCAKPGDRITAEMLETNLHYPVMNGKTVFVHAVKRMPEAVMEALNANEMKVEDIDLFIFHQANMRINEMVAKQLNIPAEKVFNTIDRFGNTTAATIPIGFEEAIKAGKLKRGMKVMTAAFGSGFTWASGVIVW